MRNRPIVLVVTDLLLRRLATSLLAMALFAAVLLASTCLAPATFADVTVQKLGNEEAAQYLAQKVRSKAAHPVARLLLPFFQIDTSDPEGETTFFAVRNESLAAVDIEVRYYASDRPNAAQFISQHTLAKQQVLTFNVRSVSDLAVDGDGFAKGFVIIETVGGEGVIHGDTFQFNPGQAFATGSPLLDIDPLSPGNDLCGVFTARFLNGGGFDGGTLFNFWVDSEFQPNPAEPILFYTVYNQEGDVRFVGQLAADEVSFQVPVSQLVAPLPTDFGAIEIEFADSAGHVSLVMNALDLYSVGFEATCTE